MQRFNNLIFSALMILHGQQEKCHRSLFDNSEKFTVGNSALPGVTVEKLAG